jgi:hypothetical protein
VHLSAKKAHKIAGSFLTCNSEVEGNTIHEVSRRDSEMQRAFSSSFRENMTQQLTSKPGLSDFLIPSFSVGCRRPTPGPGYLESLVAANVNVITDPISHIASQGIVLTNGQEVEVDCIVCATGFNVSHVPPFPVAGQLSLTMEERFTPFAEAYLSLVVDSFPNYFMMLGPNSAIGSGSLTIILEAEGDYIVKCIRKLQKENYASMAVKKERVRDWAEYCQVYFRDTVYTDDCRSWYKTGGEPESGHGARITGLWPGSTLHALEALQSPRWDDFEVDRVDEEGNKMDWLGNGWSLTHMSNEQGNGYLGDPAWYLEPEFVDVPVEGEPEKDALLRKRPFSY